MLSRIAQKLFPNVFAPTALQGLDPSWSGIISRIINPLRTIQDPVRGTCKRVTVISRDEETRVTAYELQQTVNQYPTGSFTQRIIKDFEGIGASSMK